MEGQYATGTIERGASQPEKGFIDRERLKGLAQAPAPSENDLERILGHALKLRGLGIDEVATLLRVGDAGQRERILNAAMKVKESIYGRRMVFFAPLYIGNTCSNNCLYCGFRKDNKELVRAVLNTREIEE